MLQNISENRFLFYLSDDVNNMLTNFKNGTWALIDDVPTNEIVALKVDYPEEFDIVGQISTADTSKSNQTGLRAGLIFASRKRGP